MFAVYLLAEALKHMNKMPSVQVNFKINGLTCNNCVKKVKSIVEPLCGKDSIDIDLKDGTASLLHDPNIIAVSAIMQLIESQTHYKCDILIEPETQRKASVEKVLHGRKVVAAVGDEGKSGQNTIQQIDTNSTSSQKIESTSGNNWSKENERSKCYLQIKGMTCASCVNTIEKHLLAINGINSALVALMAQKAEVAYNPLIIRAEEIAEKVSDLGFDAVVAEVESSKLDHDITLHILGMTCASCVDTIESNVKKLIGIKSASVALATHKGRFIYDPAVTGPRNIIDKIEDLGQ